MNRPTEPASRVVASPIAVAACEPRTNRAMLPLLALVPALMVTTAVNAQSCAAGETSTSFGFTGSEQTLVVPAGVSSLRVFLSGAQGGAGRSGAGTLGGSPFSPGGAGGLGGRVSGTLAVVPGTTLSIWVGGQGSQAVNGGGNGQGVDGIGGGATDVRVGGNAVGNRVAVAGGGGGGGNAGWSTSNVIAGGAGGAGGGGVGSAGATVPGGPGPFGGAGGALGVGGAPGAGCGSFPGTAGQASGDGGDSFNFSGAFSGAGYAGGGGGGAQNGGGGGGAGVGTTACQQNWNGGGGGGAGGSSAATGLSAVTINNGVQAGNGAALVCFAVTDFQVGGNVSGQTGPVVVQLVGSNPASSQQVTIATGSTTFVFPTRLPGGADWTASVLTPPAGQLCTVSGASGTAIAADVTSISVTCTTVTTTVNPATLPGATMAAAYSQTITASSANGATAPFSFAITAGSLPAGLTLAPNGTLSGTPTAAGSFTFTVQATSSNGFSGTRTYTVATGQASQAITGFTANPAAPVYVANGTFTVSATGGASANPVVFASTTPATCSVSGSTVTMLAAGSCALSANQAGDANYSAAPPATLNIGITAASQAISNFLANPGAPVFVPNGLFSVSANGGPSTSPVVFASTTPAVCSVSGGAVTMLAAGNCALTANQAADGNYTAAPQATLTVVISPATPTVAWIGALQRTIGDPAFDLPVPSSNSAGAFTYSSSNTAVATVAGRTVTIVGNGVATLVATQAAVGNYTQASVSTTLTVATRPDPTRDPGVVGGLQAQVDASVRFASAQQSNIRDRLRQQRHAVGNSSSNGMSLNLTSASGGSLSLAAPAAAQGETASMPQGFGLWSAGTVTAGDRGGIAGSEGFDFRSDGLTFGADWRINDDILVGLATGFGWNNSEFDQSRSEIDGDQRSLSLYGLWRAGEHFYLDGTLGWGRLDFDIRRWSGIARADAVAHRAGGQTFGALTFGYEHSGDGMTFTGYGRLDGSRTELEAYRESGLGIYDLAYGKQKVENTGLALGMEGSYLIAQPTRQIRPYWMIEYRDAFEDRSDVTLNYVVMPVTTDYSLRLNSYGNNALTYGAGVDMGLSTGWRLSLLLRREHADGQTASSSFGFMLSYSPAAPAGGVAVAPAQENASAAATTTGQ